MSAKDPNFNRRLIVIFLAIELILFPIFLIDVFVTYIRTDDTKNNKKDSEQTKKSKS